MSDTPRTDNLARGNHVVPTEFAEELEKELAVVTKQRDRLAKACDRFSEDEILQILKCKIKLASLNTSTSCETKNLDY
jgi:hypothetical protein